MSDNNEASVKSSWRRIKEQWSGISFEKKLSLFIAPVVVSVVSALIIRFVVHPPDPSPPNPSPDPSVAIEDYQDRIRTICQESAALNAQDKKRIENLPTDDPSAYLTATLVGANDGVIKDTQLKDQLKVIKPPAQSSDKHHEAVATWEREIATFESFVDDLRAAVPAGPEAVMSFFATYDVSEHRRLEDQKNGYLRSLAGSGCEPSGI